MTIADRDHDLTALGKAIRHGKASDPPELVRDLHAVSGRGQFTPRNWHGFLYQMRIERIFLSR
jgi:hypothetical protein